MLGVQNMWNGKNIQRVLKLPTACYATGKAATTCQAHSSIGTKMKFKYPSPDNHENPVAL